MRDHEWLEYVSEVTRDENALVAAERFTPVASKPEGAVCALDGRGDRS
jgi:hypothetical protein